MEDAVFADVWVIQCAEKAGDVRGHGTWSPETVWFELSLVGHVTSLRQFLLSKGGGLNQGWLDRFLL